MFSPTHSRQPFSASLFVIGDLLGCVIGGPLADKWERRSFFALKINLIFLAFRCWLFLFGSHLHIWEAPFICLCLSCLIPRYCWLCLTTLLLICFCSGGQHRFRPFSLPLTPSETHEPTSETSSGKEPTEPSAWMFIWKREQSNHLLGRREKELLSNREFDFKDCYDLREQTNSLSSWNWHVFG